MLNQEGSTAQGEDSTVSSWYKLFGLKFDTEINSLTGEICCQLLLAWVVLLEGQHRTPFLACCCGVLMPQAVGGSITSMIQSQSELSEAGCQSKALVFWSKSSPVRMG